MLNYTIIIFSNSFYLTFKVEKNATDINITTNNLLMHIPKFEIPGILTLCAMYADITTKD